MMILKENNEDSALENTITFQRYWTPIGEMLGCFIKDECCLLEFVDRKTLETELQFLRSKLKANFKQRQTQASEKLGQELEEYFAGERKEFTISVAKIGTEFQLAAWEQLLTIPYGETRSYKKQAERIGKPTAIRAVANANGHNRIAIIIPCHRVIGENGDLTGYSGGLDRKRFLLNLEKGR